MIPKLTFPARPASGMDIAPGSSMTSHAEDGVSKEHSSLSDRDHLSMHSTMAENDVCIFVLAACQYFD